MNARKVVLVTGTLASLWSSPAWCGPSFIRPPSFAQAVRSAGIEKPLAPEEIASAVLFALEQPEHVAVSEIMVRPVTQEL